MILYSNIPQESAKYTFTSIFNNKVQESLRLGHLHNLRKLDFTLGQTMETN